MASRPLEDRDDGRHEKPSGAGIDISREIALDTAEQSSFLRIVARIGA
jgi:hypothetical protein